MGAPVITDEALLGAGATIVGKTEGESRKLQIPRESIARYEALIREKLSPGFWNEYIGADKIHFIFKLADGSIQEFDLSPENEREVDMLCAKLNNEQPETTANVFKYISENDFYHDLMAKHWQAMIER